MDTADLKRLNRAGKPWCAICESTKGPFVTTADGRLICSRHEEEEPDGLEEGVEDGAREASA